MARCSFLLIAFAFVMLSSMASAAVVEHTFNIGNLTLERLCEERVITAVNGQLPGPAIIINEGDTVIVHVINQSPYNATIHWHGVFQRLSPWADGPEYITQCPILPGNKYTYKFNVTQQEGTVWWHSHFSWQRATVHGLFIIHPKNGSSLPYPEPDADVRIILGEWWNANVMDVVGNLTANGGAGQISDAFTINGQPGDLYPCSKNETYKLTVVPGKTYLLRILNAAMNNELFFKIADHNVTVVGIDASYTEPYNTDVVVIAPGQTVDVLLKATQSSGRYYMAAHAYANAAGVAFDNTTTTGILQYDGDTTSKPIMPILPAFNDTPTAFQFYSNLTSLMGGPHWLQMPQRCDHHMLITEGLGVAPCDSNITCQGPNGLRFAASMNNVSMVLPTLSLLEAYFFNVSGVFTTDFPKQPPVVFDYTNTNLSLSLPLAMPVKSTRITKLKYNATVEIVFQNTALVVTENHPIHLHGFNFFVIGQGFGNYDPNTDNSTFNLVNPQQRNTIAVPVGGWAVIRFQANNPGMWFIHCHLDLHFSWGFSNAFLVENGGTPSTTIPPPPSDLPKCF